MRTAAKVDQAREKPLDCLVGKTKRPMLMISEFSSNSSRLSYGYSVFKGTEKEIPVSSLSQLDAKSLRFF